MMRRFPLYISVITLLFGSSFAEATPRVRAKATAAKNFTRYKGAFKATTGETLVTQEVKYQIGRRTVHKVFFPVFENTARHLVDTMVGRENRAVLIWARPPVDRGENWMHYVRLATRKEKVYGSYYDNYNASPVGPYSTGEKAREMLSWVKGSRYIVGEMSREKIEGTENFLDTYHTGSQYTDEKNAYADAYSVRDNDRKLAGDLSADCMWWLTNARTSMKKVKWKKNHLLAEFDLRGSRGPHEWPSLLIHAGNRKVTFVGVAVKSTAEFVGMTMAEKMGEKPQKGGAIDAIRPKVPMKYRKQKDEDGNVLPNADRDALKAAIADIIAADTVVVAE